MKKQPAKKNTTKPTNAIEKTLNEAYLSSDKLFCEEVRSEEKILKQPASKGKKKWLDIINLVTDPETGVGISDMGLIYDVEEFPGGLIKVLMTLTSMGCPAGGQITTEIDSMLRIQPGVTDVKIEIVWEPPWNPLMMNPEIKAMLFGNN